MTWQCINCGEQHGDQFDACWQCVKTPAIESSSLNSIADRFLKMSPLPLKLVTCLIAGLTACCIALGPAGSAYNLYSALFLAALICLFPGIRWTSPAIILGFCLGPMVFEPFITRGSAQYIQGAIFGAVFGMIFGISMEFGAGSPKRSANNQ